MSNQAMQAPALATVATGASSAIPDVESVLELEWDRRCVDGLVYGLSLVSVPMWGGSDRSWGLFVDALQTVSEAESTESGGFVLVKATQSAIGGRVEVGVYTDQFDAPTLESRLGLAVARANRASQSLDPATAS